MTSYAFRAPPLDASAVTMHHIDYLNSIYDLTDRKVVDVGTGDGTFLNELQSRGANALGIEIDAAKVAAVQARLFEGARLIEGRAECLPTGDSTQDLVCFNFSFHHVPIEHHDQALAEAVRVLRPSGALHVVEPLPEGSMFDLVKLIDDESHVRAVSHERMNRLEQGGAFKLEHKLAYTLERTFEDFSQFLARIIGTNPERSAKLPSVKARMERQFQEMFDDEAGCCKLYQPCIAYHFKIGHRGTK